MHESSNRKIIRWGSPEDPGYCETIYTYYHCKQCAVLGVKKEELNQTAFIQGEINKQQINVKKK